MEGSKVVGVEVVVWDVVSSVGVGSVGTLVGLGGPGSGPGFGPESENGALQIQFGP